jgi:molybdenum cofactor guanylyltransferase
MRKYLMFENISAAILTGGKSSRMNGCNKAFLSIGGVRIFDLMMNVIEPMFSEIYIVSNDDHSLYKNYPAILVPDSIPGKGPLSGIHSALQHSKQKFCFIFACDLPFISSELIMQQTEFIDDYSDVIVPQHEKGIEPLHAIWAKQCYSKLDNYLNNVQNFKISRFLDTLNVKYFETGDFNHFVNINTPEDLRQLQKKYTVCNEY